MASRKQANKTVWRRNKSQYSAVRLSEDPSFDELKSVSKKLAIISRLQQKKKGSVGFGIKICCSTTSNLDIDYQNDTENKKTQISTKRPHTTIDGKKGNSFYHTKKVYQQEKKINQNLIAQKYGQCAKSALSTGNTAVKEGLLGQYNRYNEMSKQQLIEKLISLQYLANNIFRKNKALEDKIQTLEPNFKIN